MIKNITLSADERLINEARLKANCENKSLNVVFRDWLNRYVFGKRESGSYKNMMKKFNHIQVGTHFNRDELNER